MNFNMVWNGWLHTLASGVEPLMCGCGCFGPASGMGSMDLFHLISKGLVRQGGQVHFGHWLRREMRQGLREGLDIPGDLVDTALFVPEGGCWQFF